MKIEGEQPADPSNSVIQDIRDQVLPSSINQRDKAMKVESNLLFLEVFIKPGIKLVEQPHKIPTHRHTKQVICNQPQIFPTEPPIQQDRVDYRDRVTSRVACRVACRDRATSQVNQVRVVTLEDRTHTQVRVVTPPSNRVPPNSRVPPITGVPTSLPRTNDELSNLSFH